MMNLLARGLVLFAASVLLIALIGGILIAVSPFIVIIGGGVLLLGAL